MKKKSKCAKIILLIGIISASLLSHSLNFSCFQLNNKILDAIEIDKNLKESTYEWDEQIRIPVGSDPFSVFIGDANNDGWNDIVTANFYGNNVSILLWNSTTSYWDEKIGKSVGIYPTSISIGDVNNDGFNDIVAGNQNTNDVSIFLWNASINDWNNDSRLSVGGSPWYVYIADANNDGWNDIVTANYMTNDVSIILWNASISYWNPQIRISVGTEWVGPIAVSVEDADNDGYNDIVVANDRSLEIVAILWNSTINNWNSPKIIYDVVRPYGVVIKDANNDGFNDVIVANRNGGFVPVLMWNTTWNNWTEHQLSTSFGSIFSVAVGDINNDGYNDIVNAKVTANSDVASIHLWNMSSNYWDEEIQLSVGGRPECVVIGDADNDGHNDVVTSNTGSNDVSIIIFEPAYWFIDKVCQVLSQDYFNFTFYIYNEDENPIDFASFQIWWDEVDVSTDLQNLGNGLYFISLESIFVLPGEDPIKLNMTLKAIGYDNINFEIYIAVPPYEITNKLNLDFLNQTFSIEHFNFTFYIFDSFNQAIDFATIQFWWNGTDVSTDIQNLGNGLFFISLESIIVRPGEDPILLKMIISANGYQDKHFEMYLAVDPDILDKDVRKTADNIPITIIIIAVISIVGVLGGGAIIYLLRKRKRISESM